MTTIHAKVLTKLISLIEFLGVTPFQVRSCIPVPSSAFMMDDRAYVMSQSRGQPNVECPGFNSPSAVGNHFMNTEEMKR